LEGSSNTGILFNEYYHIMKVLIVFVKHIVSIRVTSV
jgi:hypothetical protein